MGFNFAFGIGNYLDPSIGSYTLNYVFQASSNNNTISIRQKKPLNYEKCSFENYRYPNKE